MEQQQSLSDDSAADPAQIAGLSKNAANEEDPKVSYALDMQVYYFQLYVFVIVVLVTCICFSQTKIVFCSYFWLSMHSCILLYMLS